MLNNHNSAMMSQISIFYVITVLCIAIQGKETCEKLNTTSRMVTSCTTPNCDPGYCMPIQKCATLYSQIRNPNAQEFLNNSRCGPKNENQTNYMICCGTTPNYKRLDFELLPKKCGSGNVTVRGRIFGGQEAVLGEFPWMARLYHKDKAKTKTFGCTGFLISQRFVLTAAHCLKSDNINVLGPVFEVHLGEHDTLTTIDCNTKNTTCADKLQKIRIGKTVVHEKYKQHSKNHIHDIGLIYLKKPAKLTSFVSPICLLDKADFDPFEYWLSGWGTTETASSSTVKMKVSIPPFSHSNCTKLFNSLGVKISHQQICAGGQKNKDSCTGDSGGPLMFADKKIWYAYGVVSYGQSKCGAEGWPAVYTKISSYTKWITKQMGILQKPKTSKTN